MTIYEYVSRDCPSACTRDLSIPVSQADTDPTKALYDDGRMACPHGYTYKRVFTPRISRYRTVANPGTADEREFTTERQYARYLREKSAEATDYTGIEHSFVPTDFDDPDLQPKTEAFEQAAHRLNRDPHAPIA